MPATPPGETRARVLEYVQKRLLEGRPPTIREVQQAFRFRAVETARAHLEALIREGRLSKREGESRGFELPLPGGSRLPRLVPILGRVQAGVLSTAVEGGNPPDIAALPQPGFMTDFAQRGALKPITFATDKLYMKREIRTYDLIAATQWSGIAAGGSFWLSTPTPFELEVRANDAAGADKT